MEQHAGRAGKSEERLVSVSGKGMGSIRGLGRPNLGRIHFPFFPVLGTSCIVRAGDRIPADSSHHWSLQGLPSVSSKSSNENFPLRKR